MELIMHFRLGGHLLCAASKLYVRKAKSNSKCGWSHTDGIGKW